ncbi:MAG: hypothetical protein H7210_14685 [Pyrinomonadaceae bacterium]|nr:hypothetical protein [Phycisphaerales bacterium]
MSTDSLVQHPPHADFGNFIVMRRRRGAFLTFAVLLGLPGFFCVFLVIASLIVGPSSGSAPGGGSGTAIALGVAALSLLGFVAYFRKAMTSFWFYELGVVRLLFGKQTAIAYADAERFQFAVTRQYHNGMYVGTVLKLRLLAPAKREIAFGGPFKVKSKGFIKRQFETRDELDVVKRIIAEQMAVTFVERILSGETIIWAGLYSFSPEGLTPIHGKHKGQVCPYAAFVQQDARDGSLHLFVKDEPKSHGGLSTSAMNFWPCYFSFLTLAGLLEAVETEGAESEPADAAR